MLNKKTDKPEKSEKTEKSEKHPELIVEAGSQKTADVPLCECGAPIAPGQSFVCAKHIKSS